KKIVRPDPPWNLLAETADLHLERWSDPPGSKWVTYARSTACFAPAPTSRRQPAAASQTFTVARYVLDVGAGTRPLPLVTETLPLAEAFRRELMRKCRYVLRIPKGEPGREELSRRCPSVTGKDESGQPLKDHKHAFFLAADEDGDGRIDHVTVLATR